MALPYVNVLLLPRKALLELACLHSPLKFDVLQFHLVCMMVLLIDDTVVVFVWAMLC